ncbi:FkbM family methyltransferase [Microcoleus sp. BR0-C5]
MELETLRKLFDLIEIDFVFDIGANIGQYYKRLRQDVGYEGLIVSFEPMPELVESINNLKATDPLLIVEQVAITDFAGAAKFFKMKNSQFSSLKTPNHTKTNLFRDLNIIREEIEVPCSTLTEKYHYYKQKFGFKNPFLKMDTQGNDVTVIRGGLPIIQEFCAFQSELNVLPIYDSSVDFREALYFYENIGFSISSLFLSNRGHFPALVDIDVVMINNNIMKKVMQDG